MLFKDRAAAGQLLAGQLTAYTNYPDVTVLALPRGGIPVAFEVAKALNVSLDVFLVRKLSVPGYEELAMGAIASDGLRVLNQDVVRLHQLFEAAIHKVAIREQRELERRERLYQGECPALEDDRVVILVDDGLATGATIRAAAMALKQHQPVRIVVAVPIAAPEICAEFATEIDEVICAETPCQFYSVGRWYEDFSQTTDEEVQDLLKQANDRQTMLSN